MLKLQSVSLELAGRKIFSGVNFIVQEQEAVAIIGPSGAGKTLLLKICAGLIPPTQGKVWLFARELSKASFWEKQELRKKIGFSFQESALFDFLNVNDNLAFPLQAGLRLKKEKIKTAINFLLKELGLEDAGEKMPVELSGGMKKRVSLGRAIIHKPSLLFCDDPTAGLDPITSAAISELIFKLREELKFSLVLVSNQLSVIGKLVNRVYLLYRGRLKEIGSAKELDFQATEHWSEIVGV